ncbi:hypothetical protein [Glutamicibacter arilaitensis]|uniref:hypothetical protein n=1 Tax=Glutamicibacter arilaitensis TaxID=256701 RepID=UPI003F933903
MNKPLAVPLEKTTREAKAWQARIHKIAAFGSQQCQNKDTVHSAICTITGSPDQLTVNLACTSKSEDSVSDLMQYANDTLLPQMEKDLGVRFEVRNLQYAVAGRENLLASPEHADPAGLPKSWLDHPLTDEQASGPRMAVEDQPSILSMA